ncbi:MAG: hypothetical protein LBC37_05300, partial [Zoogloeaceae bacterium]|nr:hypothetical protein [Zoogloeaceae bacterium]
MMRIDGFPQLVFEIHYFFFSYLARFVQDGFQLPAYARKRPVVRGFIHIIIAPAQRVQFRHRRGRKRFCFLLQTIQEDKPSFFRLFY